MCEDHHTRGGQGSSREGGAGAQPQGGFMDDLSYPSESEEERVAVPREEASPQNTSEEFDLGF